MNYLSPIKHVLSVQVTAEFDDEAGVWVATSRDVPGLVAEHAELTKLEDMVADLVPILVAENGLLPAEQPLPLEVPIHFFANATSRRNVVISA